MSAEARGILVQLLAEQWRSGKGLPVEDDRLFELASCSRKQWKRCKDQILSRFESNDGRLRNQLLSNLQREAEAKSAQCSQSAKLNKRKGGVEVQRTLSDCNANAPQTHREGEVDVEVEREEEKEGGTLSRSFPLVESSQSKSNGNGNTHSASFESGRATHLARALANKLAVPGTPANLKSIEYAIKNECLVSHCEEPRAAEIIAAHTNPASFGTKAIRFFFEDADWRNDPSYGVKR
jgi:uncharacterized protein YdaU (DUF1376 family)